MRPTGLKEEVYLRAIPCQFSGSGQVTLSNFPEILLKLLLPHMMNICKI